jgi:hypothetical protein
MDSDKNNRQPLVTYADEVLCANWHPLVLLLAEPRACVQKAVPEAGDVEGMLARLYLSQQP